MNEKKFARIFLIFLIVFLATKFVSIPMNGSGYIHLGDTFMLVSGVFVGGIYGAIASSIAMALVDLSSGYAVYVLATFVIKFVQVLMVTKLFENITTRYPVRSVPVLFFIVAIASSLSTILGYFIFELLVVNKSVAFSNISYNVFQSVSSAFLASLIIIPVMNVKKELGN
ncbi:MAG: ECF transporter S component [Lachnospirales bacterium]